MLKYLSVGLMLLPTLGWTAQAYIMGQGRVLSTPDYVELGIQVQSQCYSTPKEAREANDDAARKIVDFLNEKINGEGYYNKVISEGGFTQAYSTYHREKVLCQNTFQKNTQIRIRTQKMDQFESLFDSIQKEVYKHFETQPRGLVESSVTFVTLSSPNPQISSEHQQKLERDAMGLALNDAKAKLKVMFAEQPITNLKISEVSEIAPEAPRPMPYMKSSPQMMAMDSAEGGSAPVQFDDQWIHKTVYFRFTFDDLDLP